MTERNSSGDRPERTGRGEERREEEDQVLGGRPTTDPPLPGGQVGNTTRDKGTGPAAEDARHGDRDEKREG